MKDCIFYCPLAIIIIMTAYKISHLHYLRYHSSS